MAEKRILTILYGSQTGTAQDLAEEIWRESKRYYFKSSVMCMDDYLVENLIHEQFVIFVCSTTGQGDEPDNMKGFWKFLLRKSLPLDSLVNVNFAILGLGDSSYLKFNFVAKKLSKRLAQLGGQSIIPLGLCDDQHDLGSSAVSNPWIAALWKKLTEMLPIPNNKPPLLVSPRQLHWNVNIIERTDHHLEKEKDLFEGFENSKFERPFHSIVKNNIRTTAADHFQDVRLITFTPAPECHGFGDVLMVRPRNSKSAVTQLFNLFKEHNLGLTEETAVRVTEIDDEFPVPCYYRRSVLLGQIAEQVWDLNAIPRPRALVLLASDCTDDMEREKLLEMANPAGQEDLYNYINRPRRTVLEVLQDFPHATSKLTLQKLFGIFQCIKPRAFSIASPPGGDLQLLVAVVEYRTILKTPRRGLCSNWLAGLQPGNTLSMWIRDGTFRFPKDLSIPLIMVGPGTGLAPFRSVLMWRERQLLNRVSVESSVLFFGCRGATKDFHCREDLERLQEKGILKLFCAFSRDQENKIYVQHQIEKESSMLKTLLENGALIFVAGSSKNMPQAVKDAFSKCSDKISDMVKRGQYQEETWS